MYGASSSRCRGGAVLGHLAGVAAGALQRLELELDRHGAHRADLLRGGRPDVVRLDDGTEPLGRWRSPGDRRRRRRGRPPRRAGRCRRRSCSAGRTGAAGRPRRSRSGSPTTSACDDSASIDWAREIRGTSSIANAVTPQSRRSATRSSDWLTGRKETVAVPAGQPAYDGGVERVHRDARRRRRATARRPPRRRRRRTPRRRAAHPRPRPARPPRRTRARSACRPARGRARPASRPHGSPGRLRSSPCAT